METEYKDRAAVPVVGLQSMKRKTPNNTISAVYPNDPYLWWNNGWDWVGAGIVSPNTTASANICEIDTGVDYTHPDLIKVVSGAKVPQVIKGYDFVNADADPMDDNGHGTHVAGIMVAVQNNKNGVSGVSTGKIVAVKALNAQGSGTNYNVAAAINFCANRSDIKVINMSLGGSAQSTAMETAINNAVNVKGKLVVASAGNDHQDVPNYPAFFANNDASGSAACAPVCPTFPALTGKVLAVAASGYWYQDPPDPDPTANQYLDNNCQASFWGQTDAYFSNYGSWVSVVAPGSSIYSTTPWDKPFYLNWLWGMDTRYAWLDGTSMAAPFVAASAARRWGYHPLDSNTTVASDVMNSGPEVNADGTCWDASMAGKHQVNVAALLDRGAFSAAVFDAATGTPLNGATVGLYQGGVLKGSAVITPNTWKADVSDPEPTRIFASYNAWTDIINLPAGSGYVGKVSKSGYTATPQVIYQHVPWADTVFSGGWNSLPRGEVPPRSANFTVATGWWVNDCVSCAVTFLADGEPWNLDTHLWLPNTPNPLDASQVAPFIVGPEGDSFGYLEGDPMGTMLAFPYAIFNRDGGWNDSLRIESITFAKRAAHGTLAANAALPYYPGNYVVMLTDYGQIIDQDADGCGDNYGWEFDWEYDPNSDPDCAAGTLGIPLLGAYFTPFAYVWKDGVIKQFVAFQGDMAPVDPGDACNSHWWKALQVSSGLSGAPLYTSIDECGEVPGIEPYHAANFTGRMGTKTK